MKKLTMIALLLSLFVIKQSFGAAEAKESAEHSIVTLARSRFDQIPSNDWWAFQASLRQLKNNQTLSPSDVALLNQTVTMISGMALSRVRILVDEGLISNPTHIIENMMSIMEQAMAIIRAVEEKYKRAPMAEPEAREID